MWAENVGGAARCPGGHSRQVRQAAVRKQLRGARHTGSRADAWPWDGAALVGHQLPALIGSVFDDAAGGQTGRARWCTLTLYFSAAPAFVDVIALVQQCQDF